MAQGKRYEVGFMPKAYKDYQKLPKAVQLKLDELTERWVTSPRASFKGRRHLRKNEYRCWVGLHHRVEWMVNDEERTVTVTAVGTRERMR